VTLAHEAPVLERVWAEAFPQWGVYKPILGDGRAALLGERRDGSGRLRDLHLKGIGPTSMSRVDGFAVVGPMLRGPARDRHRDRLGHRARPVTDPDAIHHLPRINGHDESRRRQRRWKQTSRTSLPPSGGQGRVVSGTRRRSRQAIASTAHPQPALGEVNVVHARSAARAPH
jgi:hypothetical protein